MASNTLSKLKSAFFKADILRRLIYINAGIFLLINLYLIIAKLSGNTQWLAVTGQDLFLASTGDLSELILRPWSIITYMFTHVDPWHLIINMLVLYWFGSLFQQLIGQRKLLAVYLLGGLSGLLAFILAYNIFPTLGPGAHILGASAGVMSVMVGVAAYKPDLRMNLILIGPVKIMYIALVYVVLDFVSLRGNVNLGGHIGHLGGALFGFLWAMQFRNGNDIAVGFERLLDRFFTFFRPGGASFRVVRNKKKAQSNPRFQTDEEFNAQKKADQDRIDAILDKISKAGYDSLSKAEKEFLFKHSDH